MIFVTHLEPDIFTLPFKGLALVAGGTDLNFQPMHTYVTDVFTLHG